MDHIDVKYINLISSRLSKFKKVKPHLYNFRCPICGDSQRQKNKARGYLYQVKNNTNYKCHNCGISVSFSNFLKTVDSESHKHYVFEKFKDGKTGKNFPTQSPEDIFKTVDSARPKFKKKVVLDLPDAFSVDKSKRYLESRAIFEGDFYYAENFKEFVNSIKPDAFNNVRHGEERIVIPIIRNGELVGVQGRALSTNPVKYLTVMFEEDAPKVYGIDRVDRSSTVFVVEGPFDSHFLPNSVALCGSDGEVRDLEGSDIVFVYDNEPRNREIVGKIEKVIDGGGRVVIWPSSVKEKDLNDMVLVGRNVKNIVESNIYSGLEAKLKFTTWKKT